jgi:uncharacterized damage-inducible protein DinB
MKYIIGLLFVGAAFGNDQFADEFGKRWTATRKMAVGVAQAMPPEEYPFKPDPPSMNFGEQMAHIATINFAFCSALKDMKMPDVKEPVLKEPDGNRKNAWAPGSAERDAFVKYLADSFDYCSAQIATVTDAQMNSIHSTPDGELNGRELMLALYVHLAHHRGQAEIYLRIKGTKPPAYVF